MFRRFIPYILIAMILAAGLAYAAFWRRPTSQATAVLGTTTAQPQTVNRVEASPPSASTPQTFNPAAASAVSAPTPGDPLVRGGVNVKGGVVVGGSETAIVQTSYNSTYENFPTVGSVTLTGTVSGNTIVATAANGNNTNTISISGCGNNWTQLLNNVTTTGGVFDVWMTAAPGGTCTATATPSTANNLTALSLTEISGINGSDATPLAFRNSSCTNCQTTTTTPVTNGDLIFVWNSDVSQLQTYTAYTNGFTQFAQGTSTSSGQQNTAWSIAYLIQKTAASISTAYSISANSGFSQNVIMAFKPTDPY